MSASGGFIKKYPRMGNEDYNKRVLTHRIRKGLQELFRHFLMAEMGLAKYKVPESLKEIQCSR